MEEDVKKLDDCYNKAAVIAERLKEDIVSQRLSGKLPSESVLAERYTVNIKTVNKAIGRLIDSGYVYRQRGIGTFIRDNSKRMEDEYSSSTIALFMPSHGHLYEDLYNSLTKALKADQIYPILMNSDSKLSRQESRGLIDQALRFNCKMLLVAHLDGSRFDYEYLRSKQTVLDKIVFINCHEESGVNALRLVTAPEAGAEMATTHLLEHGCRHILYVSHGDENANEKNRIVRAEHFKGYQRALKKYGLTDMLTFGESNDMNDNVSKLKKIIDEHRPDGAFCVQDSRAVRVMNVAESLGMSVPTDLKVVGYYNTPWSRLAVPPLTSVSICEQRIAEMLCERIRSKEFLTETVVVKPEVIARESTQVTAGMTA